MRSAENFVKARGVEDAIAPELDLGCRRLADPPDEIERQLAKAANELAL